jgi:hypothetical protein
MHCLLIPVSISTDVYFLLFDCKISLEARFYFGGGAQKAVCPWSLLITVLMHNVGGGSSGGGHDNIAASQSLLLNKSDTYCY